MTVIETKSLRIRLLDRALPGHVEIYRDGIRLGLGRHELVVELRQSEK